MATRKSRSRSTERKRSRKPSLIARGMISTVLLQLLVRLRILLDAVIDFIFSMYWDDTRQTIPDLNKNISFLAESATSIANKIREQQLRSVDVVAACMERILVVNPIINAVTDQRYVKAIAEARDIDKQIQSGMSEEEFKKKPFLGVPFTSKECHAVEGLLHTFGVNARRNIRAQKDAECVRLMKEAGAIIIAVSNVPEICMWQETRNMVFGQTKNPYHTGRAVGGSSGGEGALVSSLCSPIGLVSDIGGSTRMPAFYCGLFGHYPTPGVTNIRGIILFTGEDEGSMGSVGVLTKHAEDITPLTKIIAGEKAELLKLDRNVDIKNIKFYYTETSRDLRCSSVSHDLRQAMNKVLGNLSSADHAPQPYYHEGFNHMFSLWRYWMTREEFDFASHLTNNHGKAYGPIELVKKLLGLSQYTLAAIFKLWDDQVLPPVNRAWAESLTQELRNDLLEKLGEDSVLLFPSCSAPAPYHYSCFLRPYNFSYWCIFNVLKFPTTQVPLGLNARGLPLGIQVVAAPYNDALCLEVAKYLEKEFGGYVPPCKVIQ